MLVYVSVFLAFALLSLLDLTSIGKKQKTAVMVGMGLIIILLSGLRWERGTDWDSYNGFFNVNYSFNNFMYDDFYRFEPGYSLFNYLIKTVCGEYSAILFIIAMSIVLFKYVTILKFAMFPLVTLLLNIASSNADIFPVRQSIAVALCVFSIKYVIDRAKVKFVLCVLLAATFHVTALFFLAAYKIYQLTISRKMLAFIVLVSFILGTSSTFQEWLFSGSYFVLGEYIGSDIFAERLLEYGDQQTSGENFGAAYTGEAVATIGMIRRLVLMPFMVFYLERFSQIDNNYRGFLNLTCFGYAVFGMFMKISSTMAGRLSIYYFSFDIFVIPFILFLFANWKSRMAIVMVIIAYSGLKCAYGISSYYDLFIPYRTIFD